jgi:lysophospholipase L1-like esterase
MSESKSSVIPAEGSNEKTSRKIKKSRRIKWLLILGGLLCTLGGGYRYFWLYHPVGIGPAGPEVASKLFSEVWSEREILLVGLGDSITDGYGSEPNTMSYFNRLVENPNNEFAAMRNISLSHVLPNLKSNNLARSGTTSIENLEFILPELEIQNESVFGVVVMTTGGNDVIHNYGRNPPEEGAMYGATFAQAQPWIKRFQVRLDETIREIEKKFPGGCCILIGDIYDPTDGVGDTFNAGLPSWPDAMPVLHAYNDIIADCAKRHSTVHVIKIHDAFLGHGIHSLQFWRSDYDSSDPHYWYYSNLEDPNNRGYDVIRRLYLRKLAEVLPKLLAD